MNGRHQQPLRDLVHVPSIVKGSAATIALAQVFGNLLWTSVFLFVKSSWGQHSMVASATIDFGVCLDESLWEGSV
jgi:hypothetical protein